LNILSSLPILLLEVTYATSRFFGNSLSQLRFVLCNAQSLGNKLQDYYLLYNDNLDILLITESWLDDNFTSGLLDPECKFNIYRKDRNRHGGGVCVFVSKILRSSEVHIDERFNQLEMFPPPK